MKKLVVLSLVCALSFAAAGCGEKTPTVIEPNFEAISDASDENTAALDDSSSLLVSSEDAGDAASSDVSEEVAEKASEGSSYDIYRKYISPKAREEVEIDAGSAALYDAFLADEAKAKFSKSADNGMYVVFSDFLEDGKSYTLSEIANNSIADGQYGSYWKYTGASDSYIDCGLDESIEMVVELNYDSEFTASMVIKNVGGELKICFDGDSWSRCSTEIIYSGLVYSFGSGGASLHGGYYGFINADGDYTLWYETWEEGFGDRDEDNTLTYYYNEEYTIEGADLLFLESFTFDKQEQYYYFYLTDSDMNDVDHTPVNGVDPYEKVSEILTKERGYTVLSADEAKAMIVNRKHEIGLSDEVAGYGDELKPEGY
jgi:hypothetical protein